METKKQIRKNTLEIRNSMNPEEVLSKSYDIMEQCVSHFAFSQAEEVLFFVNFDTEVNTKGMIAYAFMLHKRVFCPVVDGDLLVFIEIQSLEELTPGYHTILEPVLDEQKKWVYNQEKETLVLVPGVAFDIQGNRIGYGKGFYDRFFQKEPHVTKMALCFECQILDSLPVEQTDQLVDWIVTEQRVIEIEPSDDNNEK